MTRALLALVTIALAGWLLASCVRKVDLDLDAAPPGRDAGHPGDGGAPGDGKVVPGEAASSSDAPHG